MISIHTNTWFLRYIFTISFFSILCQSLAITAADLRAKKRKINQQQLDDELSRSFKALVIDKKSSSSHINLHKELAPYCAPDVTDIIHSYCGQLYAFAAYSYDEHEKEGAEITHVHMSPGEIALAICAENHITCTSKLSFIQTANGQEARNGYYSEHPIIDCSWRNDLKKVALSIKGGAAIVDALNVHHDIATHVPKTNQVYAGRQQYLLKEYSLFEIPKIVLMQNQGDSEYPSSRISELFDPERNIGRARPESHAVFLSNERIFSFGKTRREAYINQVNAEGVDQHNRAVITDITSVDVSMEDPILGDKWGYIHRVTTDDQNPYNALHAFQGMPVEIVAASPLVIAAASYKTIKAFSRATSGCIMDYDHKGSILPSLIKVAPDGKHLAYAAGRALRVLSLQEDAKEKEREVQWQVFDQPITDMYYGHDNGIYLTYGGTITKFNA